MDSTSLDRSGQAGFPRLPVLVGRDREIRELLAILGSPGMRLLTITGPGGVGKTALARGVVSRYSTASRGRVVSVPLVYVQHDDRLLQAVAGALRLHDHDPATTTERVIARLQAETHLLLLDNAEHLAGTASLVQMLTDEVPSLRVLVTSRVPLNLSSEQIYALGPLELPAPQASPIEIGRASAVMLFCERAAAASTDFTLSPGTLGAVAELCARLDGLPLALELAAAQVRTLSPETMLSHFRHSIALLDDGPGDRPEHQRSLRRTIAWSECLLDPKSAALLRVLAVFSGGASVEDAAAVSGLAVSETLQALRTLTRHHLIRPVTDTGGLTRYELLQTIREYALDRLIELGQDGEVRGAHACHFLEAAQQADALIWTERQPEVLARLAREHDNFRAALSWSLQACPSLALELTAALGNFWTIHGHLGEGRGWTVQALSRKLEPGPARTAALRTAGEMARMQGRHAQAQAWLEESLRDARAHNDVDATAAALNLLGVLAHNAGRPDEARTLLRDALSSWQVNRRDLGRTTPAFNLGRLELYWGDPRDALVPLQEALAFWRGSGNRHGAAYALYALGRAFLASGEPGHGESLLRESLDLRETVGDERGIIASRTGLGLAAALRADTTAARTLLTDALLRSVRLGHSRNIAECLEDMALLAVVMLQPARAVRLCAAAHTVRDRIGAPPAPLDHRRVAATLVQAGQSLSDTEIRRETQRGALLDLDGACAEALALAPARVPDASGVLSPRERQVLSLVAQGYSDREIARSLSISHKTASSHVSHILVKLELRNRVQLTRWAVEHSDL